VDPAEAFPDGRPAFAVFGDSDGIQEGDFVLAMGSPLSLSRSVSFGIISCRERTLGRLELPEGEETGKYHTWLQTDAAINPGNSGGPLVNLDGEVIGVNTRASLVANNIGFAIPSATVREVVEALRTHGGVPRAYVGVSLQPMDDLLDTTLAPSAEGVLVAAVDRGSPAERAGILPGDFLTALDGAPFRARFVEEVPALYHRLSKLPVGGRSKLEVLRGGASRVVEVVPELLGRQLGNETDIRAWGVTVRGITARMRVDMALPDGARVMVTGVRAGGPAVDRLEPGDILQEVQGREVQDLEALLSIAADSATRRDEKVRVIYRRGTILDVTVLRVEENE
jgi:serine protease Do